MKRILYTVIALWLLFQSMIGVLSVLSMPENAIILLGLSALSGWGAYWFGQKARALWLSLNAAKEATEQQDTQ